MKSTTEKKLSALMEELTEAANKAEDNEKTRELIAKATKLTTNNDDKNTFALVKELRAVVKSIKEIPQPKVNIPSTVDIKEPTWTSKIFDNISLFNSLKSINDTIKETAAVVKGLKFSLPKEAKDAIPVRLADDGEFYKAVADVVVQGSTGGGGGSVPTVATSVAGIRGVPVVNPDGTDISGSSGSGDGTIIDGVSSTIKATVKDYANSNPLMVAVSDASGDIITSFGGGTQYTEGDTDASITGTALMMEGAANALVAAPGTAADGLLVNLGSNNDVTITGTVAVTQSGTWDEVGINDSGNSITVDGTVTADTELPAAAAQADNVSDPTTTGINVYPAYRDGSDGNWDRARALSATLNTTAAGSGIAPFGATAQFDDSAPTTITEDRWGNLRISTNRNLYTTLRDAAGNERGLNVAATGNISVDTVTTVTTVSALGTGTTGPMKAEDVSHSTGDMGIPAWGVRQDTPNATAAASGDYHYLATDMVGGIRTALYETDFAVLGTNHVKKYYTNSGAVTDGIVWSPAAGKRWYVTDIFINVSAAATITLEDDKAGGDEAVWKMEAAANSGWSHHFGTPLFSGEDAADLLITTSAGNVYVTVTGYEI